MISAGNRAWAGYGRAALVVVLAAVAVQNGAAITGGRYLTAHTLVAVATVPALLLRRVPWFVAPALTSAATGLWGWSMLPLLLVALFDLAARRRAAVAVGCCAVVLAANALIPESISLWQPQQYGASLFLLLAVVAGLWMGSRRRLVQALNDQVRQLRVERTLREESARAAERSRIAAEMHDVLAHRLSLIALHTGVLTTRAGTLPEPIGERLTLLRTASTEALSDLRDILSALHQRDTTGDETVAAPVLRDVHELAEQARAVRQQVDLHAAGAVGQAPAAHRLAVYRLVQEALTNARKHAAGEPVRVRVDYGPPTTVVEVTNDAGTRSPDRTAPGFGLVGLRERIHALGGRFTAGPYGTGSWRLTASIPHPVTHDGKGTQS